MLLAGLAGPGVKLLCASDGKIIAALKPRTLTVVAKGFKKGFIVLLLSRTPKNRAMMSGFTSVNWDTPKEEI